MPNSLSSSKTNSLKGIAKIPGDKSISHRAIMFGAIADGQTTVQGLLEGEDVLCTAAAMRAMGADIEKKDDLWVIEGTNGTLKQPGAPLDMGNSGTSTRLLMGLVSGHGIDVQFIGDKSLSKRPMQRITNPLSEMGISCTSTEGRLPLTVTASEKTLSINYELPVASAQVKSAVLLAGLQANGTTTIIENKPTRDHTERMLRAMGATVVVKGLENGGHEISLNGRPHLTGGHIIVPSDPSSAAFPVAAASLCPTSKITVPNICMNPARFGFYETLADMGANITFKNTRNQSGETVTDIEIQSSTLNGINVPTARVPSMIDEFPVLSVIAACANGTTYMTGLAELRVKESDRLAIMASGLKACGVNLEEGEDSLTIYGTGTPPKGGALIKTELDHRIAMSFLILGCVTESPVTVDDATPIATSFPDFINLMTGLGAKISAA